MRESADLKARRYLAEGRLVVTRVDQRWIVASVRGDGEVYRSTWHRGTWSCTCPARGRCAHLLALGLVTAPSTHFEGARS